MSVASWYFARDKSQVGSLTVVASVGKTFVFHIGTAAFGALIVAIVEVSFLGCGPGNRGVLGGDLSRHRSVRATCRSAACPLSDCLLPGLASHGFPSRFVLPTAEFALRR